MHHTNDKYCKCPLFKYLTLWWTLFISLICTSFDWCSNTLSISYRKQLLLVQILKRIVYLGRSSFHFTKNSLQDQRFIFLWRGKPIITQFLNLTPKSFVNLKHKLLPIRINLELFNFE